MISILRQLIRCLHQLLHSPNILSRVGLRTRVPTTPPCSPVKVSLSKMDPPNTPTKSVVERKYGEEVWEARTSLDFEYIAIDDDGMISFEFIESPASPEKKRQCVRSYD